MIRSISRRYFLSTPIHTAAAILSSLRRQPTSTKCCLLAAGDMACTPEAKRIKIEKEMRKEKEKNVKIIYATNAELRDYHIQDFDVEDFKGIIPGGIGPCQIDEYHEQLLIELSNLALQTYNDQNGASFKFDNIIKANQQVVAGYMYYITFAAHSGETSGTFRGKVWLKINFEKEVEFCKMI